MRFEYADGRMPVRMVKDGSEYYLAYDQVGSLRVVVDAAGNVIKRVDYDSFGNLISDSDPAFEVPFGFAGGLYDQATGLIRFGYRDYDPDVGRWTAKDPIGFAGGDTDLYGYVLNDPVNFIDPAGLFKAGLFAAGVLSITDGLTIFGTAFVATAGTMALTGNPVLTGIVGLEMIPVAALGIYDVYHGAHLIAEAFEDDSDADNGGIGCHGNSSTAK